MSSPPPTLKTIEITQPLPGVAVIALNRPEKFNALSPLVYKEWLSAIQWATRADNVRVAVMTGKGKYYSSGQELQLVDPSSVDPDESIRDLVARNALPTKNLVKELILFPKLLFAAVNGPVIGFGCTTLALCDFVYAHPSATFNTPFMQLGFCAEGCSSVLFPRILGPSRAAEMLLLGKKFSAEEMRQAGFLSAIMENVLEETIKIAGRAAKLPPGAMMQTRELVRRSGREELLRVNEEEMTLLVDRMVSDESAMAMLEFAKAQAAKKAAKGGASKL